MPDLRDGESVEMRGSAAKPYVLKNVGGVYSCTCPAWRNQSNPIERRTCKHLRKLRGDAAEEARIGNPLPTAPRAAASAVEAPPLLLAESWDGNLKPTEPFTTWTGSLITEEVTGVLCRAMNYAYGPPSGRLTGIKSSGPKAATLAVSRATT